MSIANVGYGNFKYPAKRYSKEDRGYWNQRYLEQVAALIGPMMFTSKARGHENTTLEVKPVQKVAFRVREFGVLTCHPHNFVMGVSHNCRQSVAEYPLFLRDHSYGMYFYAQACPRSIYGFNGWYLLDLNVWRREHEGLEIPHRTHGDEKFMVYDVRDFSDDLVIGSRGPAAAPNCHDGMGKFAQIKPFGRGVVRNIGLKDLKDVV